MSIDSFKGNVIHGDKIARTLGFPTANLDTPITKLKELAVYCGYVKVDKTLYRSVMCVNWKGMVEVHILDDFKMDIYGKEIFVDVRHFIRIMEKIDDIDILKKLISEDVKHALDFMEI